jgi:hypothetical protein
MNNLFAPLSDFEAQEAGLPVGLTGSVNPVGSVIEAKFVGSTGSVTSVGLLDGVLTEVRNWLSQYISVMDNLDLDLITLWIAHTHLAFETYSTPRLLIDSSMPGSGKTTLLEHLGRFSFQPVQAASLSSPALLTRMLHAGMRTILIDEVDRSLDPKKPGVEDLIAVLNSGYKRGATRPVLTPGKGGEWVVTEMTTFSPVAMAGNSPHLPDDTRSRCIRVLLMPDLEGRVESSDWEEMDFPAAELSERVALAAEEVRETVRTARPPIPAGCIGRIKERWYPLKRVATAAGGKWPDIADTLILRDIAEAEMDKEDGLNNLPPAVKLLKDIHDIWPTEQAFMPSTELASLLIAYQPSMWGVESTFGKDLTVQRLGRMLVTAFKIHSTRQGDSRRGYHRKTFDVAFRRMGITLRPQTDGIDGTGQTDGACPLHDTPIPAGCFTCHANQGAQA